MACNTPEHIAASTSETPKVKSGSENSSIGETFKLEIESGHEGNKLTASNPCSREKSSSKNINEDLMNESGIESHSPINNRSETLKILKKRYFKKCRDVEALQKKLTARDAELEQFRKLNKGLQEAIRCLVITPETKSALLLTSGSELDASVKIESLGEAFEEIKRANSLKMSSSSEDNHSNVNFSSIISTAQKSSLDMDDHDDVRENQCLTPDDVSPKQEVEGSDHGLDGGGFSNDEDERSECSLELRQRKRPRRRSKVATPRKRRRSRSSCSEPRSLECEVCCKKLSSSSALTKHQRTHNGAKPYKCEVCGMAFADNGNFNKHVRTHSKPLQCKECGKTFPVAASLEKHALSHSEKLYECMRCGSKFTTRSALRTHLQNRRNCTRILPDENLSQGAESVLNVETDPVEKSESLPHGTPNDVPKEGEDQDLQGQVDVQSRPAQTANTAESASLSDKDPEAPHAESPDCSNDRDDGGEGSESREGRDGNGE